MSEDDDDFSFAEASDRQRLLKPIAGESSKKRTKSDGYGALSSEKLTDWSANEPQLRKKSDASKKAKKWSQVGVFTYATTVDYILLTVGVLASVIHGAGFPLLSIVLGGMTSVFLRAQNSDFVVFDGSENQPTTALTNSSAAITPISRDEFTAQVGQYSIYYLLLGILMFVTSYIQIACFESLAERLVHSIRQHYFAAILRQDISWFDTMQTGSLTARLTDDLERVREGLGDKASLFIQMVAAFASGFVVGLVYSWQMTLVMLIFTPALAYTSSWLGQMMARRTRQELEQYSVAGAIAEETFSSMRTVLSLNGQRQELERYAKALADGRKIGYLKYFSMSMGLGANYIIMFLSYAVAFWFASRLVIWYPEYDRGAVFTVFFAVMSGSTALGAALPNLSSMSSAKGALYYVLKVLNTVPKIDPYSSDGVVLNSISGAIEFSNVHFSYPLRESVKILEDISFSVPAGKKLALVGASGCGKSTIVNMILRFYDPDCGRVTLDGHDLRDLNVKALRDLIGVVSQEPILFDGTLEENIMLGNEYATRDDVNRCCKMANAYNFIHSLPDGLYTRVGERGAQLSGGQKQRIAIARALIKNPRILLLDEATSALDTESEALVQEALDKAQEGRTTIIVAHRLATIRNVDQILVFHQGRIVERGTHEELYALSGIFAEMIDTQQIQRDEARAAATLGTIEDANKTVEAADEGDTNSSDSHNDGAFPATESSPVSNPTPSPAAILRRHKSSSGTPTGYRNITDERVSLLSKKSSIRSISGEPIPGFRKRSNIYGSMSSLSSWRSEAAELREMQYDMAEARLQPTPMRKIFRFNRERWGYFALGMLGCALSGALTPLFALVYSQIVAVFSEPADQLASDAILWSGMFVVLGVLNALGFFISANALGRCGEHLTEKLRYEAFRNLMRQDIAFYDDERHNTGKLCTRFATDTPNVRFVFTRLPSAASALFTLFGAMLVGFINGWRLAIVLLALVPLIIASGYFEMRLRFGKQMRNTKLLEDAGKIASEAVENIRTVAGLNNQLLFHRKYCANLVQPFKTNMLQAQYYAMVFAFSQSLIFFMYALAFFVGSVFVLNGSMTPISVFRVFFAIAFCGQSVGQMSSFIPDVVKARVAASLLFHLIEYPTAIDSLSDLGISMNIRGDIELRNVKFAYPTRRHVCVLNGINLDVRAGQTFALVGYSGCGKSTIIALLERFYNPRRGHLIVDGVNIADYNIHRLREQICLVSQEPILFNTTIAGNICYGLEATADELAAGGGGFSSGKYPATYEQIVEAAEEANIHTFVLGLPDGYETMVGEKGVQLSGGQKQRIAIARALIRRPTVLLLDEATSALDTESERVVQEALENARKGRTCIVIAHRLSTIQNADQIAVINDGRVVQKGTHEELLQQDGIYKSLCQTQILATADATTQQEQRTSAADVQ